MTETAFRSLERLYGSPRREAVLNWFVAQALEKLGLVKVAKESIVLSPSHGPAKRLVRLTRLGTALCKSRTRDSARQVAARARVERASKASAAIPPAFWLGIVDPR